LDPVKLADYWGGSRINFGGLGGKELLIRDGHELIKSTVIVGYLRYLCQDAKNWGSPPEPICQKIHTGFNMDTKNCLQAKRIKP